MTKRENEFFSVKDLMHSFMKENNLSKGMSKLKIKEAWIKLMGQGVASYTDSIELQNKTLIVKLSSSVLRGELNYGKEKIIKMLNDEVGEQVVYKLMLV
ncbi:MAG: DUF721 domain-containing protein [Flavobacteriaceae bacterium]|nr:MAG: DUF721 domain-containing protein [Flavobacteriaceae bacterium]